MKRTSRIMGMSVTLEVMGEPPRAAEAIEHALAFVRTVDRRFSPYKPDSELSRLNAGAVTATELSSMFRTILNLSDATRRQTDGYFDIRKPDGSLDPSGLVKGWAIREAARIVVDHGFRDYFVEAGEDIQTGGRNSRGQAWTVGVRNPFRPEELAYAVRLSGQGIATSGTYRQGGHIYDPHTAQPRSEIVSCTVVGPDIYEADRFATAACAMGERGIELLERRSDLDGQLVTRDGRELETSGFATYLVTSATPVIQG